MFEIFPTNAFRVLEEDLGSQWGERMGIVNKKRRTRVRNSGELEGRWKKSGESGGKKLQFSVNTQPFTCLST